MTIKCEWTEQEIIDDLLGETKDKRKKLDLHNHLTYCRHCQKLYDYWENVFGEDTIAEKSEGPSTVVKQRVFQSIAKPRKKKVWYKKQAITAACVGLFLLATSFYVGRISAPQAPTNTGQHVGSGATARTGYLPNQKMAYRVVPVHDHNTDGYVWVNPNTKDIMLFLDGLKPLADQDYQAWIVSRGNKENAGILQIDQNFGHVIVHNPHISSVERIIISIEPRGGSTVQTGPNALDLDIRE